jgi:hypothetical protein
MLCIVVSSLSTMSCKESTNPDVGYNKLVLPLISDYISNTDTVDGSILVQQVRDSIHGFESLNYFVSAEFVDVSTGNVDAGTLTYNGLTVTKTASNYYTTPEEVNISGPTRNTTFNGTNDIFNLAGSAYFPGFTDTMQSTNGSVLMTAPLADSTYSRASNLSVAWSGTTDTGATVVIAIRDTNGHSYSHVMTDGGAYTVPAAELSSFPNNDHSTMITVYKFRYKVKDVSSKKVGIVELTHHTKHIAFKP